MAEPANLGVAARLVPLPVRDPNRPIGADIRPPQPRPARPGPDGFQAPALPGADLKLSNGIGIRPPARPGSSGAALGPVAGRPQPTGIADQPRNPGDIGAAPRLEQRPDARPAGDALEQRFAPPQRLVELLDAQRGREVAAEIARLARGTLFEQPDVEGLGELLQLHRHRRLRKMQLFGSPRSAAQPGDGLENEELREQPVANITAQLRARHVGSFAVTEVSLAAPCGAGNDRG